MQVDIHEAKKDLSRLIRRAVDGEEEVVIARAGKPIARLVPFDPTRRNIRRLGRDAGLFQTPDDFNGPLPGEIMRPFES